MTSINRLTQIAEAADNDILPIWDYDAKRTRGVLASTLKEYVAADEVVNAKIVNDHLILITKDGNEIDAGLLPSSDGIDLQNDGTDIGEFSTLNFGEGLVAKPSETFGVVAEVDIDKDKVYTKDVDLPIKIDDLTDITRITTGSGLYSLKKDNDAELVNRAPFARTLRFDQSITLSEPYDGLTAIYATENTAVDDIFHLDIDPDDSRLNKDWVFTVAIDSDITKSTLECKIGKTNPISFNLATGFAVLEVDSQKGEFVVHNQSGTVTGDLDSSFCDLSNAEWKNIPSKEWIVRDGTLTGFGTGIDGKTARLRCQVSNSSIDTTEIGLRAIEHVYTIISDDATINGRVFARSSKSKSTFDAATLREETNSAGSGSITIDGNSADKIVSGDGIKTTFDPASNTATLIAEDFDQPDVAGFGTVSELPRHLIKPQLDEVNLSYDYDDDKFNAKFANGEPGPAFKITAQKLGQTKWELGFTYADRLTSYQTVMSRMLVQFLPDESTGTFDDLVNKVDFRCEKGIGGVFKHKHEGQDLLELWCIAATSETPNRFFLELDLSANDDKYVFNTREPQFTEYLFPWNDINKPPQFVQLEEGMNNQGQMGSGSNIDSGSVTQGKVYVDDFNPSNGGPEGLEGNARKGYVIKHYGFNDQETASVIWFYNFVGDIYVKMNKSQGDKGRWNKVTGSRFANTRTFMLDANEQEYLEVDRTTPVIVTEETDSFVLIKIIEAETEDLLPKVKKVSPGELASGFSLCPDNTPVDTHILQISSGTYSLDQMTFAVGADVGDGVYVDENGKLSLIRSQYECGWVVEGGVIIDIDLYNKSVKSVYDYFPEFKSVYIDALGSGNVNFMANLYQDGNLNTALDATRAMKLNIKSPADGSTSEIFYADNSQAQFLVPIVQGVDPVALKKEIPVIPDNGYIEKYNKAETDYVQIAYQGKYGDDRVYYPSTLRQDVNGWLQFEYTGNLQFKPRDKSTDELGDTTLRIGTARSDFYHPLYIDGKRAAERTSHHIYNTYSLNDLITSNSESFVEWMTNNPDYTQVQFLNTLFSCTVLGSTNWIASATTSGEDYNGTFPNGYQQIEIHRNGGGSRSFLRAYNKESPVHYFANYKANQELNWKQYAYTDELGVLKEKTSYDNEIQNIDTTGTGVFAEYLGYGSTSAAHTHTFDESGVFWISNLQSSTRPKTVNVISSNGAEMTGISVPFNRVVKFTYSSDIEEIITEASYADVDINSNTRNSYSGQGLGTPKPISVGDGDKYLTEPVGYYISQPDKTGNLTIYVDDTGGYNEFRVIYDNADNKPRDIKVSTDGIKDSTKTIQTGEVWECRVTLSRGSLDQNTFFWTRLDNGESGYILDGQFNSKSGYSKLVSGGGSTHTITYSENGSILKISNATVKVQLLQGMSSENPHGYIKYINSHNDDVAFEWYDRNGNQVTSNVPSVCPANTVVEIFADYAKDEYVLNFGQSKVIQSINEDDELMEGLASGVIYAKTVTIG